MNDTSKPKQQLIDELAQLRQRVAELEHAEARRKQTEESYQVLVDHSLQGMAIYQGGRLVFANARLIEILGRPIEALLALNIDNGGLSELIHPDDFAHIQGYLRNQSTGQSEPSHSEMRALQPDGTVRWVEVYTVALEYAGRPALQVVLIDITERKRAEERIRYQASLLQNVSDAIISSDLDFKIVSWNKAAERQYGWRADEVTGKSLHQVLQSVYPGYDWDSVVADFLAEGHWEGDIIQTRKDGTPIHVYAKASQVKDEAGHRIGSVTINRDITEREQMAEALRHSHYLLERSQQLANLGSWQWDLCTDQMLWSPQMHRIHGTDPTQFPEGVPLDEGCRFIHPDDLEAAQENARRRIEEGITAPLEYRIVRADGVVRTLFGDGHVVHDDHGKPVSIFGMVQDITERKEAEEQALALLVEQERSRILAQFIQDASHEFRTPLSMISLNAHAIREIADPVQRIERLQRIEALVRNIAGLVDNLVTMARLDSGVPFKLDPINIGEMVNHVRTTMHGSISKARLLVVSESTIDDDLLVEGSLDFLYQAIASILDNAIRHTPPGGTITLRTYQRDGQVILEVQDTGTGIDEKTLPHIFERFYRADQAHSTRGFGLGLPIAQKIIEHHHGQIEVETRVGKGSTFRIVLNV